MKGGLFWKILLGFWLFIFSRMQGGGGSRVEKHGRAKGARAGQLVPPLTIFGNAKIVPAPLPGRETMRMPKIALALLCVAAATAPFLSGAQPAGFKRIPVQRVDLSTPGREAVQAISEPQHKARGDCLSRRQDRRSRTAERWIQGWAHMCRAF